VSADFETRLRCFAEVIVGVGLNLRPGQGLLIAEPFELQGVSRAAGGLVDSVREAATAAGAKSVDVNWGDEERLSAAADRWPDRDFESLVDANTARMERAVANGDALLFLQSSQPGLLEGTEPRKVAGLREMCWRNYGRVAVDLVAGRTNWTVAPAPIAAWASAVFPGAGEGRDLSQLWETVFAASRVDCDDPLVAWREHLDALCRTRDELNTRRHRRIRLVGPGTDLRVELSPDHVWCTACLTTHDGRGFVANLPTEEVFTAPDAGSADGTLRLARPFSYGGAIVDGGELEFRGGRVVRARARTGDEILRRMLATDEGASRLGEIALVRTATSLARTGTFFFHPLLDENAMNHVALGDGYPFTVGPRGAQRLNHSLVHVDLPVEAEPEFG
jgi:aminopeptidase